MESGKWLLEIASWTTSLLLRLIKVSNSASYIGFEGYRLWLGEGKPVLIAFWHNQGLFMPFVWFGKPGKIKLIVSQSKDGDLIAALLRWFGILSVRGSSSRGSTAALKELLRLDRAGEDSIVFTPDGPKGPIYRVKEGVAYLALSSKKPLYLLSVTCSRVKVLDSWDRFRIPLPFGKATYVCSPPLYLSDCSGLPLPEAAAIIEECLMQTNRIADALSSGVLTIREASSLLSPDRAPWSPYSVEAGRPRG
ncbi:MAG: lysophospholipid acyltransferase family protein [Nitrospirae bacterium]|nr:lysophospholipid acyltransferase family protein [Nitrospirota bacterium]